MEHKHTPKHLYCNGRCAACHKTAGYDKAWVSFCLCADGTHGYSCCSKYLVFFFAHDGCKVDMREAQKEADEFAKVYEARLTDPKWEVARKHV